MKLFLKLSFVTLVCGCGLFLLWMQKSALNPNSFDTRNFFQKKPIDVNYVKGLVEEAIAKKVLPKSIPVLLFEEPNYKFLEIDFRFRTPIVWSSNSKCPQHEDMIIDASRDINTSIPCPDGDKLILASSGNDWIKDAVGNNIIYAGEGNDTIKLGSGSQIVIFEKGWGNDKLQLSFNSNNKLKPKEILGDDGTYGWEYSSFLLFGKGIKPEDLSWENETKLVNLKTADSIEFTQKPSINFAFMDYPDSYIVNLSPYAKQPQIPTPTFFEKQKVESILVDQQKAYLCKGNEGIMLLDIQDISKPLLLSRLSLPGRAMLAKRYKNMLLVAQTDFYGEGKYSWISLVDVTNPSLPTLLSSIKYANRIYDFEVVNDEILLAETNFFKKKGYLHRINISDPTHPKEVFFIPLSVHTQSLALHKDTLFLPSLFGKGIYRFNLSDQAHWSDTQPIKIGNKSWIHELQSNENVLAALSSKSLFLFDLNKDPDLNSPTIIPLEVGGTAGIEKVEMILKDYLLFIAQGKEGVLVYDISDLTYPKLKNKITLRGKPIVHINLSESTLYVKFGDRSLGMISLEDLFPLEFPPSNKENSKSPEVQETDLSSLSKEQLIDLLYHVKDDEAEVYKLLDAGASLEMHGHEALAPIEIMSRMGHNNALKALLSRGANPNYNNGQPLIFAALANQSESMKLLVEYGANVNAKDSDKCTPLHYSAAKGNIEMVTFLLAHGADKNALCRKFERPIDWARNSQQKAVVELLKAHEQSQGNKL
jgi:hypothetical protein